MKDQNENNNTLTRARLVDQLYDQGIGYTKQELRGYVDSVIDIMCDKLKEGEVVKLSGFGNLKPKDKAARVGRNPHTEEKILISRRRVVSFQTSQKLNTAINS
jgi:integration host factor subunit alpha